MYTDRTYVLALKHTTTLKVNAASATDKENDMRHIPLGSSRIVIVNNTWLELLAGSSRQR